MSGHLANLDDPGMVTSSRSLVKRIGFSHFRGNMDASNCFVSMCDDFLRERDCLDRGGTEQMGCLFLVML